MEIKIIKDSAGFDQLKAEWENLQETAVDLDYYSTYHFNRLWWDYYGDAAKKLFLICVYNNKRLVGVGPFYIETKKLLLFQYRTLKFLGRGDYFNLVIAENNHQMETVKAIFNYLKQNQGEWEQLYLTHIRSDSLLAKFCFKQPNYFANFVFLGEVPFLHLAKYESLEEYRRQFGLPTNLKRYCKKLTKEIGYTLRVYETHSEALFARISAIHQEEQAYLKQVKQKAERHSLFENQRTLDFLKRVYQNNFQGITFALENNQGEILIYITCYYYRRILYTWNTGFNPRYAKYSLGRILDYEVICYLFSNPIADIYDFGAGRYPWKFEWTDDFQLLYQLNCWNEEYPYAKLIKRAKSFKNNL